jgi:hypothetical protein
MPNPADRRGSATRPVPTIPAAADPCGVSRPLHDGGQHRKRHTSRAVRVPCLTPNDSGLRGKAARGRHVERATIEGWRKSGWTRVWPWISRFDTAGFCSRLFRRESSKRRQALLWTGREYPCGETAVSTNDHESDIDARFRGRRAQRVDTWNSPAAIECIKGFLLYANRAYGSVR